MYPYVRIVSDWKCLCYAEEFNRQCHFITFIIANVICAINICAINMFQMISHVFAECDQIWASNGA